MSLRLLLLALLLPLALLASACTGDDDDSADDDDAADDDDSAANCPGGDALDGTIVTADLTLLTGDAPAIPGSCAYLTLWGYDSNIADQAANELGTFVSGIEGLPSDADVAFPADAHDRIEPGGETPANNRFYITGWIDVDGDGVEGSGDYTSAGGEFWADPPPANTDLVMQLVN